MHIASSDARALSSYEESYSCFPGREKAEIRNKTQEKYFPYMQIYTACTF